MRQPPGTQTQPGGGGPRPKTAGRHIMATPVFPFLIDPDMTSAGRSGSYTRSGKYLFRDRPIAGAHKKSRPERRIIQRVSNGPLEIEQGAHAKNIGLAVVQYFHISQPRLHVMRSSSPAKTDADITGRPNPVDSSLVGISTTLGIGRVYLVLAITITAPPPHITPNTPLIARNHARPQTKNSHPT